MNEYRVMVPSAEIKSSPTKLTGWLNDFTVKNKLELVAVDEGTYIFKGIQNED